jgi:hypothetical protein
MMFAYFIIEKYKISNQLIVLPKIKKSLFEIKEFVVVCLID